MSVYTGKHVCVVGGTSGLGLEMAKLFRDMGAKVTVTGRDAPDEAGLECRRLYLGTNTDVQKLHTLVLDLDAVDCLVYAAGYSQVGAIETLSAGQIAEMVSLGLSSPIYLLQRLLRRQGSLQSLVVVTSSSARRPRAQEPVYAATKAGLEMFARSVALGGSIGKTLVVAPGGMQTKFWREDSQKDVSAFLDPAWVAEQAIWHLRTQNGVYKHIALSYGPNKLTVEE
jgi:hypothetical protein